MPAPEPPGPSATRWEWGARGCWGPDSLHPEPAGASALQLGPRAGWRAHTGRPLSSPLLYCGCPGPLGLSCPLPSPLMSPLPGTLLPLFSAWLAPSIIGVSDETSPPQRGAPQTGSPFERELGKCLSHCCFLRCTDHNI